MLSFPISGTIAGFWIILSCNFIIFNLNFLKNQNFSGVMFVEIVQTKNN